MATGYVLYNPLAGNGSCGDDVKMLEFIMQEQLQFYNMTRITNYEAFLGSLTGEDYLVIAGGDGTLNRFINDTEGIGIPQQILYFPVGTGNDFARDVGQEPLATPFPINRYLQVLPTVTVKGKTYRFLNGVGYGIDGYCCQVGDALRERADKKVNYTAIAIKGLLFHYRPTNAKITVDGISHSYKKVWLAPTMLGRFYGGGMMAAPEQDRQEKTLSVMLFHGAGRLRTLCAFPSIFKGTHVKHAGMVTVLTGQRITVEFDRPAPLQIDGETILDVSTYTACAAACKPAEKKTVAAV